MTEVKQKPECSVDLESPEVDKKNYYIQNSDRGLMGGVLPSGLSPSLTDGTDLRRPVSEVPAPLLATAENERTSADDVIFGKKHNLIEILKESFGDSNSELDLSYIKELISFPDLNVDIDDPKIMGKILESWKCREDKGQAQGDTVLQNVMSAWEPSFLSHPGGWSSVDKINTFRSNKGPILSEQKEDRYKWEADTGNLNSNMSNGLSSQQINRFNIPVLQRHKWNCRSAPDLRAPVNREQPVRCLSQYDLSFSHSLRKDGRKSLHIDPTEDNEAVPSLLWGPEAYRHYRLLTLRIGSMESKVLIARLQIEMKERLQMIQSAKTTIVRKYMWKQRILENIVDVAKAYYSKPTQENREKWKKLRKEIQQSETHSITGLQHGLARIPHHSPVFTIFLMLVHVLSLLVMCVVGKLGPAGVLSKKEVVREVQTFLGAETVHSYVIPNPWIGPPVKVLLASGASFSLCMRRDRNMEKQGQLRKFRKLTDRTFGCCEMRGPLNAAGTTTLEECKNYTNNAGVWSPPFCSQRPPGQNSVAHVIHPCCVDHRGTCQMLSQQHCNFLGGVFHVDREHCVEVMCVRHVCTMGRNISLIEPSLEKPWLPNENTVWQWWRLLLALLYTFGFLHCLVLLALEWLLMRPMEKNAGWFQVMLIYGLCGVAGQIVACTAQPYIPHVGSTSGVAGLIGEAAVELSQAWTLLERPYTEAIKLSCFFLVLLVMGLLPYVSLLGSVAGCACGAACALVFMPYLVFSKQDHCRKVILMMTGVVLVLIFYIVILHTFVKQQPLPCEGCRYLECLSFVDNMCNQWDLLG